MYGESLLFTSGHRMSPESRLINALSKYEFVLGSSSPRRKEILTKNLGITTFSVIKSTFEENLPKADFTDVDYVTITAKHKIESIIDKLSLSKHCVLLVADTIVSCAGEIFEKPETPQNQLIMLKKYRDHPQDIRVITSVHVCIIGPDKHVAEHISDHVVTTLKFDESLSDTQLQEYVNTGEGLQAAGGFMYQGKGCLLFKGIDGDYFNVVGLPAARTYRILESIIR